MLESILDFVSSIERYLWGPWTLIFIAFVSVFLTVKSGFFQVRRFPFIVRNTFGKIFEKTGDVGKTKITPFQAATTSLAGTVGMANIAGVATALSVGGPGAIFWMWLLAFLGMITKTAEITLGVHYRELNEEGGLHGGPMYYIKKGLGWKFLAGLFSAGILINSILGASLLQAHTVGRAFLSSYNISPYIITGAMGIITAIVAVGGIKRIGRFCEKIVPFMAVIYIVGILILFIINFAKIPMVFGMIFKYAFAPVPASGGFAGAAVASAIRTGMARGMLSNEAGMGTAPMVHATAETEHPFQQGIWGAFEVFIDTVILCTATSFAVLSTGVLSGGQSGVELVIEAFSTVFPASVAGALISICILSFCLSTQIGFFYYFETAVINLFGIKSMKYVKWIYFFPGVIFAGVADVDKLWVFANIIVASCGIPNLIAVLALNGVFFTLLKDYLLNRNEYRTEIIDASKKYIKMADN